MDLDIIFWPDCPLLIRGERAQNKFNKHYPTATALAIKINFFNGRTVQCPSSGNNHLSLCQAKPRPSTWALYPAHSAHTMPIGNVSSNPREPVSKRMNMHKQQKTELGVSTYSCAWKPCFCVTAQQKGAALTSEVTWWGSAGRHRPEQ